jgi:hypothetical protein
MGWSGNETRPTRRSFVTKQKPTRRRFHIGERVTPKVGQFRGHIGVIIEFTRDVFGQKAANVDFGGATQLHLNSDLRRAS